MHVVLQGYFEFGERSLSTCSVDHFNPRVIRLSGTLRCCQSNLFPPSRFILIFPLKKGSSSGWRRVELVLQQSSNFV